MRFDSLRFSRFDVVFQKDNNGEVIKCHYITSALNEFDAAFIFGQANKGEDFVILEVKAVN